MGQTSIMSSYRREVPTNNELEQTNGSKLNERPQPGDGFTDEELETLPAPSRWKPRGTYEKSDIDSLAPGPQCVEFTGRIVYLHQNRFQKPHPRKPKGYFKICVKDDTEGITVSLDRTLLAEHSRPHWSNFGTIEFRTHFDLAS